MEAKDERIEKIMEALSYCDFEDLDDNEDDFYTKIVEPFTCHYKETIIDYASGATKGVLIFGKFNFVIKIPFRYDSNWDEEEFRGADTDNGWDYCEVETNVYSDAEDCNIESCFAKTEYIGNIDEYPIYKQEMAEIYSHSCSSHSSHTDIDELTVCKICNSKDFYCFNTEWLTDAFIYYGEELFCKLMNFIRDFNVKDLHSSNIGYIGIKPVLVDYSGYNE